MNPICETMHHLARTFVTLAVLAILAISGFVGHAAEGVAKVQVIRKGKAESSIDGSTWKKLKGGAVLKPGSWVRTDRRAYVDLFVRQNGPTIRLTPSSTLLIKALSFTERDGGTDITTHLVLTQGSMLGAVKKLSIDSTYSVEIPAMKSAFRFHGGIYQLSVSGRLVARLDGMAIEHVRSGEEGKAEPVVIPGGKVFAFTAKGGEGKVVEPTSDEGIGMGLTECTGLPLPPEPNRDVPTRGEGLGVDPAKVGFNGPFPKAPAK